VFEAKSQSTVDGINITFEALLEPLKDSNFFPDALIGLQKRKKKKGLEKMIGRRSIMQNSQKMYQVDCRWR